MTRSRQVRRSAFTLLELLIALSVFVIAMTIIWTTFATTLRAWKRGGELVDQMHHGDFVMEQLTSALRSAAFFKNAPSYYGFWLNDRGGGSEPRDEISWVTSGTAFMLPDSPFSHGLHRIMISIEQNEDGERGVAVRAFAHLSKEIEKNDVEPWFVSGLVKGLSCRVYNQEEESWDNIWEDTNAIPSLVEITLFMDPLEKYGPPVTVKRIVEIPLAPAVTGAVTVAEGGTPTPEGQPTAPVGGAGTVREGGP